MATLNPERLKGLLECSVCLDHYVDPKMLNCTHVFCKQCIESIAQFEDDGSIVISCPMRCEKKTILSKEETVSNLTASYNFKNLLEALTDSEQDDVAASLCSYMKQCKKKPITSYCCGQVMCSLCYDKHSNSTRPGNNGNPYVNSNSNSNSNNNSSSSNNKNNNNNNNNNSNSKGPRIKSKKEKKQKNKKIQESDGNCSNSVSKGNETHQKISLAYNKKADKLMLLCDEHSAFCTSVCSEDNAFLCIYCQQRDSRHSKHTKCSIGEDVTVLKEILQTESDILDRLKRFKTITMQNIEKCKKNFQSLMKQRRKDCLSQYSKLLDEEEARLTSQFEESRMSMINDEDYAHCSCEYSKVMLKKHDIELFIQKEDIFNQIQSMTRYETLRRNTYTLSKGDYLSSFPLGKFSCFEDYEVSLRGDIIPTQVFEFLPESKDKGVSNVMAEEKEEIEKETLYPTSLRAAIALKQKGNEYFKKRLYSDAQKCYSKAIEYCPSEAAELAVFYQNRAAVGEEQNDWQEVVDDCSKALVVNPKYMKALLRRSRAYGHLDDLQEAVNDAIAADHLYRLDDDQCNRVAEIGFQGLCIRFGKELAENYLQKKQQNDFFQLPPSTNSIRSFLENSNHNPFFLGIKSTSKKDTLYSRIVMDMKMDLYDNVANNCTEIIKLNGQHKFQALLLRGAIRFCEHDSVNAFRDFDEILTYLVADNKEKMILKTEAMVKRACLKACIDDDDGFLSDMAMATILDSENASIYHNRAKFGRLIRTSDEVISDYRLAIDLDSRFVAPRLCLADYFFSVNEKQKAEATFQETVQLFPQNSEAWRRYSKFLFKMCRLDESLSKIDKAISLAPARALPYADKAYLLFLTHSGDPENLCRKALDIDGQCHTALCLLGHMKLSNGSYEEAIPLFEKSIKFSPREVDELHMAFSFMEESRTRLKIAKEQY